MAGTTGARSVRRPSVRGPKRLFKVGGTTEYTEAHGRNDVGRGDPTGSAQSVYSVYSVVQIVKRGRRQRGPTRSMGPFFYPREFWAGSATVEKLLFTDNIGVVASALSPPTSALRVVARTTPGFHGARAA